MRKPLLLVALLFVACDKTEPKPAEKSAKSSEKEKASDDDDDDKDESKPNAGSGVGELVTEDLVCKIMQK